MLLSETMRSRLLEMEAEKTSAVPGLMKHLLWCVEVYLREKGEAAAADTVQRVSKGSVDPATSAALAVLYTQVQSTMSEQHRQRVLGGVAYAQARGVHCGRPRKADAPDPTKIRALRLLGRSWAQCAAELGTSVGAARRAFKVT